MNIANLPEYICENYEVHEWKHASAILRSDFPDEWNDVIEVLMEFRLLRSHVIVGGGGKSKVAGALDGAFSKRGWLEKKWDTKIVVDDVESKSPTHKVDCFKNHIALENRVEQ